MSTQTRKHLFIPIEGTGEVVRRVNEVNQRRKDHPSPKSLDYKSWTKERWEHHEATWDEILKEEREKQRHRVDDGRKWLTKAKRTQQHKVLRELRKSERREFLDQRMGRKIRRNITDQHDSEQILTALKNGADTVGKVCKKTGLETRVARRCLRKLVKKGEVEKPGARRYQLTKPKQRRHLADVQPTKRRKRLAKKSKVG